MKTNQNATAKRTRQTIRETLAHLLEEKHSLTNITITELTERAGISRTTFYAHYRNLRAVVADFQTEIFNQFFAAGNFQENSALEALNLAEFFRQLQVFLETNQEVYRHLLSSSEALEYAANLNQEICRFLYHLIKSHSSVRIDSETRLKVDINFFVDGLIGTLVKYFRSEIDLSLAEIINYTEQIFSYFLTHQHMFSNY